jgi:hypothetical protein
MWSSSLFSSRLVLRSGGGVTWTDSGLEIKTRIDEVEEEMIGKGSWTGGAVEVARRGTPCRTWISSSEHREGEAAASSSGAPAAEPDASQVVEVPRVQFGRVWAPVLANAILAHEVLLLYFHAV